MEKSVGEKCWRRVLEKSVGEDSWRRELRSVGEESCRKVL